MFMQSGTSRTDQVSTFPPPDDDAGCGHGLSKPDRTWADYEYNGRYGSVHYNDDTAPASNDDDDRGSPPSDYNDYDPRCSCHRCSAYRRFHGNS